MLIQFFSFLIKKQSNTCMCYGKEDYGRFLIFYSGCLLIWSFSLFFSLGTDDDLEYYVRECGDILGVGNKLPADCRDAKHILDYMFHQVVEFKKLNQVSKVWVCVNT